MKDEQIRKTVREGYAQIAKTKCSCCGGNQAQTVSKNVGYSDEEMAAVPDGANLGLGCGNPVALASLSDGEIVMDLGAGAGFDCFLAANRVGKRGRVIGVDMTPEMLEKARENAAKGGYDNVEFRLGEIENLPAANGSVDVVISNCVINLSPDKGRVFAEAFRVLKPGGRLMVSDIVVLRELPDFIRKSAAAYVGCISGALLKDEYLGMIKKAGFGKVTVVDKTAYPIDCVADDPEAKAAIDKMKISARDIDDITNSVLSVKVRGIKPN